MTISITCGGCRKTYRAKDELAGRQVKCPGCSSAIQVPAVRQDAPPPGAIAATATPVAAAPKTAVAEARKRAGVSAPAAPLRVPDGAATTLARGTKPASGRQNLLAQVMAGFRGEMPSRRTSPMYLFGVLLTTVIMVALPLIYMCLIGVVCWVVYWHMIHDAGIIGVARGGRAALFMLLIYLSPLVIGCILVVFMIKPLFAPPAREGRRRSLTRQSEPVLFALVDKICAVVNAPVPKRIDINCEVNASASLRRGWLSALVGRDLVLTIGMPLAAGLNVEQFAGVLAHEFGHFSQGVGMRLTYVVRSINFWFLRVVYQRDSWDVWLANSTEGVDLRIAWVMYLAKLCVWLTRRVLWALMMLGNLVAGFMLRQMEFDADGYETRLVGSDTFEATARKLLLLGVAYHGAQADAGAFYREGRLPDNLPRLMIANIKQISEPLLTKLNKSIDESTTSLFDSHPSDKDRIAAARQVATGSVFQCGLPTSSLFTDFAAITRNVTYDFYCEAIGNQIKPEDLHPVDALLARQDKAQQAGDARQRFFGGQFNALRSWQLPEISPQPPSDLSATRKRLEAARQRMVAAHAGYETAYPRYDAADTTIVQSQQIGPLLTAKVRIQREHFQRPYSSESDCLQATLAASSEQLRLASQLASFEAAAGERLCLALELLYDASIGANLDEIAQKRQDCASLYPLVSRVGANLTAILDMRNNLAMLAALCMHLRGNENNEVLVAKVRDSLTTVHQRLVTVYGLFSEFPYPFDHAKGEMPLTSYLLEKMPPSDDLGGTYEAADNLFDNLMAVYVRAIDRLCLIAEEAEKAAGYESLGLPIRSAE